MFFGSRTKWITPTDDNYGFAKWADGNRSDLMKLGPGRHYGEWWGSGIQRKYGLTGPDKRFSLFNSFRWMDDATRPKCCHVVPVLFKGLFTTGAVEMCLEGLRSHGSQAVPGFMKPEGVVIWHIAAQVGFKVTLEKDSEWKGKSATAQSENSEARG